MSAEPIENTAITTEPPAGVEKEPEVTEIVRAPFEEIVPRPEKVEAPEAPPNALAVINSVEPAKPETTEPASAAIVTPEKKVDFVPEAAEKTPVTADTPLIKLFAILPAIIKEAEHSEMWGVELSDVSHVPTSIVLEKFLRANAKDVDNARVQLTEALKWRKMVDPKRLLADVEFDNAKFGGLGFVTVYPKTESHDKEIVTWNIYGSVKDNKETFGNVEQFVKWRAALMELSVKELDLPSATVPIPADGVDPYRMVQVHDYMDVSFLRMDPAVKAASKETIQIFGMAYPELLKEKFFVNVPLLMGWVFSAMKLFLAPETVKKFHPLSYGSSLAGECKGWGEELPTAYGGKGADITEGLTVKYATRIEGAKSDEAK